MVQFKMIQVGKPSLNYLSLVPESLTNVVSWWWQDPTIVYLHHAKDAQDILKCSISRLLEFQVALTCWAQGNEHLVISTKKLPRTWCNYSQEVVEVKQVMTYWPVEAQANYNPFTDKIISTSRRWSCPILVKIEKKTARLEPHWASTPIRVELH